MNLLNPISTVFRYAAVAIPLFSASLLVAETDFLERLGSAPVNVVNQTGTSQQVQLIDIDGGEILFRLQNIPGELSIPLDNPALRLYYPPPPSFTAARQHMVAGRFERAAAEMRNEAYPLIRFLRVSPRAFSSGHDFFAQFFEALVRAGQYDEAAEILTVLPYDNLNPALFGWAMRVIEHVAAEGREEEAIALLGRVPISDTHPFYQPTLMQLAGRLVQNENYEQALYIYQRLQDLDQESIRLEATLWTAYTNIQLGRLETARLFLAQAGELDRLQREFSLARLIEGRIFLEENNVPRAMQNLSQGVVYAEVNYPWTPELFFLTASSYRDLDQRAVAREVFREVTLLFTGSRWAEKSEEEIAKL